MPQYVSDQEQTEKGWKCHLFVAGLFDEKGAVVAYSTKEWPTLGEAQADLEAEKSRLILAAVKPDVPDVKPVVKPIVKAAEPKPEAKAEAPKE